jgi:cysteine synthase A
VAAMRCLRRLAGLHAGPSTGTNLWGVCQLIAGMVAEGKRGSIVSLMCDAGDRYAGSYYNPDWIAAHGLDSAPYEAVLADFFETGTWPPGM